MPPEACAYALARYSRSPDSIRDSLAWVRTHDSSKFLDSFYFQYGHASIADLGHVVLCLEGISEIAATEAEDEQLWDGQARSSRYQDFGKARAVTPPDFNEADTAIDIEATVRTTGRTGVEMEALTAASVAALTVYDMCKAIDRGMRIDGLRVVHKAGGKSGEFTQA